MNGKMYNKKMSYNMNLTSILQTEKYSYKLTFTSWEKNWFEETSHPLKFFIIIWVLFNAQRKKCNSVCKIKN